MIYDFNLHVKYNFIIKYAIIQFQGGERHAPFLSVYVNTIESFEGNKNEKKTIDSF